MSIVAVCIAPRSRGAVTLSLARIFFYSYTGKASDALFYWRSIRNHGGVASAFNSVPADGQLITCRQAGSVRIMITVYALRFVDGRIYVGMTANLQRRIPEHQRGRTKSTKNKGCFEVIFTEACKDRVSARIREKYWKSGCGKEKLKSRGRSSAG